MDSGIVVSVGFLALSLSGNAQGAPSAAILNAAAVTAGQFGFSGARDIQPPKEPIMIAVAQATTVGSEASQAVAALTALAQQSPAGKTYGECLRKIGIPVAEDHYPVQSVQGVDGTGKKYFSVATFNGTTYVFLDVFVPVGEKKEERTFLIGVDGQLLAASATRKENGAYVGRTVPLAEAQPVYQEQIGFWIRYFQANLKKA